MLNGHIKGWIYFIVQPQWLGGLQKRVIKSTMCGRMTKERPDSPPWRESHWTPACRASCFRVFCRAPFYIKACSAPRLKVPHLQERMASAEIWTPLASFNARGPLPLRGPESEDRVSIWRDHTGRCGNLKAKSYRASCPESQKGSIKTRSICRSGLSKCCTPSSPGKTQRASVYVQLGESGPH